MKKITTLFISFVFAINSANAQYLFTSGNIAVRGVADLKAPTVATIAPGESFEVLKWNQFNTRIRMSDGRIGWINKSLLKDIAPANDNGELPSPLKLTATQDASVATKLAPDTITSTGSNSSEVTSSDNPAADYAADYDDVKEAATTTYGTQGNEAMSQILNKLSSEAWKSATKRRKVADFCGGGYRSGNRSKCMCAQGAKEALVAAGVCKSYPSGNALQTHKNGTLKASCPNLTLSSNKDPGKAPAGSVIVYSGYAGRRPHNYGHIEIKVPVTAELKKQMGRAGNDLKIGQYMYCSDFCSARPTKTAHNKVAAIYTL